MVQRLKTWALRYGHQLREAGVCLALGLKDSLRWQLLWRGLLLSAALGLFWLVLLWVWRQEVLTISLFLAGAGIYKYLLPFMQVVPGLAGYAIVFPLLTAVLLAPFAAALLIVVVYLALVLAGYHLLSVRMLYPRIKACVVRRYAPVRSSAQAPLSWWLHLRLACTALLGIGLCLAFPPAGLLALVLWVGYLSSRSVAVRTLNTATSPQAAVRMLRQHRPALMLVGTSMAMLLLVPLLGLLAPTALTAATAHLIHRSLQRSDPP